jgi:hypothetical protein
MLHGLAERGQRKFPYGPQVKVDVEGLEPYDLLRGLQRKVSEVCRYGDERALYYAESLITQKLTGMRNWTLRHSLAFLLGMIASELLGRGVGRTKSKQVVELERKRSEHFSYPLHYVVRARGGVPSGMREFAPRSIDVPPAALQQQNELEAQILKRRIARAEQAIHKRSKGVSKARFVEKSRRQRTAAIIRRNRTLSHPSPAEKKRSRLFPFLAGAGVGGAGATAAFLHRRARQDEAATYAGVGWLRGTASKVGGWLKGFGEKGAGAGAIKPRRIRTYPVGRGGTRIPSTSGKATTASVGIPSQSSYLPPQQRIPPNPALTKGVGRLRRMGRWMKENALTTAIGASIALPLMIPPPPQQVIHESGGY